jgi:hypothetical protein
MMWRLIGAASTSRAGAPQLPDAILILMPARVDVILD